MQKMVSHMIKIYIKINLAIGVMNFIKFFSADYPFLYLDIYTGYFEKFS